MQLIEVVDEAVLSAEPAAVYACLMDVGAGRAEWWRPHLRATPRPGSAVGEIGALTDIVVRGPGSPRFTSQIKELVAGERIAVTYVDGDFRGEGLWTLAPEGPGKTRVRFHWRVTPQRWLYRLLRPLVARGHSRIMQLGFDGLERHLRQRAA